MTEIIKVQIEGTTPILFNRFRDVAIEGKSKEKNRGNGWKGYRR